MSSKTKQQTLSLKEIDFVAPITRVIVFLKDEILMNQIVSKKSRLKDIFISGNLDPDGNYIYEGKPLDITKTIIEILPKGSDQLTEVKIFIQAIKLDLEEDTKETYFSPILKPFENPFRILVFTPEEFTTSFKKYPQSTLKHYKLEIFSDTASAYCNTDKGLYISGGKNKGKGTKDFLKVCKYKFTISSLPEIPIRKEFHSMIFVPKNYIYFIGGNSKDTFYFDTNSNIFNSWAPLKQDKISPALALINNRYIYAITEQKNKKKFDFIEKTDLTKLPEWEKINVRLVEPFPMHNFGAAVGNEGRIYFLGGKREKGEKIYCYNTIKNIIEPCGQENSSMKISDKTFYFLNEYNSALIPNELRDDIQIILFNRKKHKFKKIHYQKDLEEIIEIKDMTNTLAPTIYKEDNKDMKIHYKKISLGKMPYISEKLLKFPKAEELKTEIGKEITSISKQPPEVKVPETNIDTKIPETNNEIKKSEISIDNKRQEIFNEIKIPEIDIDTEIPEINIDKKIPEINIDSKLPEISNEIKMPEINNYIKVPEIKNEEINIKGDIDNKGGQINLDIPKEPNVPNFNLRINPKFNTTIPKRGEVKCFLKEILSNSVDSPINLKNNRYGLAKTKVKKNILTKKVKYKGNIQNKKDAKKGMDIKGSKVVINSTSIDKKRQKMDINKQNLHLNKSAIEINKQKIDIEPLDTVITAPKIDIKQKIPEIKIPSIKGETEIDLKGPKIEINTNIQKLKIDENKENVKEEPKRNKLGLREILTKNTNEDVDIYKRSYKYPNFGFDLGDKEFGKSKTIINKKVINIKVHKNKKDKDIEDKNTKEKDKIDLKIPKVDRPNINFSGANIEFPIDIPKIESKSNFVVKEPDIDLFNEKEENTGLKKESLRLILSKDINAPITKKKKKQKVPSINLDIESSKEKKEKLNINAQQIGLKYIKINAPKIEVPKINIGFLGPKTEENMPKLSVEIKEPKKNINEEIDKNMTEPKIKGDIQLNKHKFDISNIEKKGPEIKVPELDINIPKIEVEKIDINLNTPEIKKEKIEVKPPQIDYTKETVPDIKIPDININMNKQKIDSNINAEISDISINVPKKEGEIKAQLIDVNNIDKNKDKIITSEINKPNIEITKVEDKINLKRLKKKKLK